MYEFTDYLEHHGVVGMKWGVRKQKAYDKAISRFDKQIGKEKNAYLRTLNTTNKNNYMRKKGTMSREQFRKEERTNYSKLKTSDIFKGTAKNAGRAAAATLLTTAVGATAITLVTKNSSMTKEFLKGAGTGAAQGLGAGVGVLGLYGLAKKKNAQRALNK